MSDQVPPPSQPPPGGTPPTPPTPPPQPTVPTPTPAPRRLMRSRRDRWIAGICGGIADYLGVDPTLVRVATIVIALLPGPAILAYLIAWLVIPEEPNGGVAAVRPPRDGAGSDNARYIVGGILIAIGGLWLIGAILPGLFDMRVILPLVLVAVGAALLVQGARR